MAYVSKEYFIIEGLKCPHCITGQMDATIKLDTIPPRVVFYECKDNDCDLDGKEVVTLLVKSLHEYEKKQEREKNHES